MLDNELVEDAAKVWCPDYPRKVSSPMPNTERGWGQLTAQSVEEVHYHVSECAPNHPGFVSTYGFPRGHPGDGGIPNVNTIMWDLDRDNDDDGTEDGWLRDMNPLLLRVRMFCQELLRQGKAKYWRGSLTGMKGVHLYLDFPEISAEEGSIEQFRKGIREYSGKLMDHMIQAANLPSLDGYMDVSSGRDLSRLTRLPNTVHQKATERFGEPRYCVPVTLTELAKMTPAKYKALTRQPRAVPDMCRRIPNEKAGEIIRREIRNASDSGGSFRGGGVGVPDPEKVDAYKETANSDMDIRRVKLYLSQKPCIWAWRERADMFDHGQQSHIFEMNAIAAMKALKTPIEVMVDFFDEQPDLGLSAAPGFDPTFTRNRVETLISRSFTANDEHDPEDESSDEHYRGLNCSTILEQAPSFCLGAGECGIYDRNREEFDGLRGERSATY